MEWFIKDGSSNDYLFIKDKNANDSPCYSSSGVKYIYQGKIVSYLLSAYDTFATYREGDETGNWSEVDVPIPGTAITIARNLSLAYLYCNSAGSIGGNSNNYAPDRSGENSNNGQNQPSVLTNIQYGISGATSTALLGKSFLTRELAKDFIAGGDVAEITEAAAQLNKVAKPFKILGKVLGVLSVAEHTSKFIDAYENGNVDSAILNGGKIALDVLFMTSKCVNPVFLGASVAYGVVDYMTDDY